MLRNNLLRLLPLLLLACPGPNSAPLQPPAPDIPAQGFVADSVCILASAEDPDGDDVSLCADWGDGDTSAWSELRPAGARCTLKHRYARADTFRVRVQARDRAGATSDWSAAGLLAVSDETGSAELELFRFPLRPGDTLLVVDCEQGELAVEGTADSTVSLTFTRIVTGPDTAGCRQRRPNIVIALDTLIPGTIRAIVTQPADGEYQYAVHLQAAVPAILRTDLSCGNGTVRVEGMHRPVRVALTDGTVDVSNIAGDVDAGVANGSLLLAGLSGSLDARATNGQITADIALPESAAHCRALSVNGAVSITIPVTTSAQVYAETGNGLVTVSNLALQYMRHTPQLVEGVLGTGRNDLRATTVNGLITLTGR
jgi:hypothetical protein